MRSPKGHTAEIVVATPRCSNVVDVSRPKGHTAEIVVATGKRCSKPALHKVRKDILLK